MLSSRVLRAAVTAAFAAVPTVAVGACGDSDDASPGSAKKVAIRLTDAGCEPATLELGAGSTAFEVTNAGTGRVTEFELLDGARVLGEKEHLAQGTTGGFVLTLQPGSYTMSCPGGTSAASGRLVVGGGRVGQSSDRQLAAAVSGYRSYVVTQSRELLARTRPFVAAVKAGDVARAKRLFAPARAPYETIEPVAESFGALDPELDARVNDVAAGERWTGFHRIEKALWKDGTTKGLGPIADKLLADVQRLDRKVRDETYEPAQLANGASELLDEVSASKITGEEDRYSHTDLSDFEANVAGAQSAFGLLAPALRERDRALASTISDRFDAVDAELARIKRGDGYPSYDTVSTQQRRRFSQLVDALAEPLSRVAAKLQG